MKFIEYSFGGNKKNFRYFAFVEGNLKLISIRLTKKMYGWEIDIVAWNIRNYHIHWNERFNIKKLEKRVLEILRHDGAKAAIFNRIFTGKINELFIRQ